MKDNKNKVVEKKRKERFESLPTHLEGVQLKIEPGTKLSSRLRVTKKLYRLAKEQIKAQQQIDTLNMLQNTRREEIINIVKNLDGLRGITSKRNRDNFSLTVSPSEKTAWDQEMLKKSMNLAYPMVVTETFKVSISVLSTIIPEERRIPMKEKEIGKAIEKALSSLGFSRKQIPLMIKKETKIHVDEKRLNELITLNQVKLLPKAKKSEITWKLRISPLKS